MTTDYTGATPTLWRKPAAIFETYAATFDAAILSCEALLRARRAARSPYCTDPRATEHWYAPVPAERGC